MNLIELNKVSLNIDQERIINNISLKLNKGQITTLIGPNGGGKTSTAKIALQLIAPSAGKVIIKKNIRYGYMPQKINLDKSFEIIASDFITLAKKNYIIDNNFFELCDRLDVKKILHQTIHNLSGGQIQKILFLRAIIGKPDFIVLDEPTQYMDINATAEFYHILNDIRNTQNCAILLVSHDLNLVMQKSDHVICINKHICCQGNAESLENNPHYNDLFNKNYNFSNNFLSKINSSDKSLISSSDIEKEITLYKHSHNHNHE